MPGEARIVPQVGDALDQLLAGLVGRVGLAGEDELHRVVGVVDQFEEVIEVLEEQVGPLVRGEPAGKADRQRVGIEHRPRGLDDGFVFVAASALPAHAAADELQQAGS